jgi:hypothetical protein
VLDYESIRALAKNIGRPIRDLLALSDGADPYYVGIGARREAGQWFAGIWAEHGEAGAHLRRLHYVLVSRKTHKLPSGRAYENTESDWTYLCSAGLAARYLDLIPFDGLIDRRNGAPMFFSPGG